MADLGDCGQVEGVVQFAVASRVEPVALAGPAGGFDGGGAVVGGEPLGRREPCRVTDVTQNEPRDDGADAVQLEQRCARRGDGVADATLGSGDVAVETTDVGQQLESETLALNRSSPLGEPAGRDPRTLRAHAQRPARSSIRQICGFRGWIR